MAVPLKQRQHLLTRRMRNSAKAEMVIAAQRDAQMAGMANAVTVVVEAVMVDVASAAKGLLAKSAHPAKVVVAVKAVVRVVKAAANCVKAKPVLCAVNVMSGENAQSVLHAKAVATVAAKTATKAETKSEVMPNQN